jgi:hypothetical protein
VDRLGEVQTSTSIMSWCVQLPGLTRELQAGGGWGGSSLSFAGFCPEFLAPDAFQFGRTEVPSFSLSAAPFMLVICDSLQECYPMTTLQVLWHSHDPVDVRVVLVYPGPPYPQFHSSLFVTCHQLGSESSKWKISEKGGGERERDSTSCFHHLPITYQIMNPSVD